MLSMNRMLSRNGFLFIIPVLSVNGGGSTSFILSIATLSICLFVDKLMRWESNLIVIKRLLIWGEGNFWELN